jgi:integrase
LSSRSAHNWRVVAWLRHGTSLYQARADASAIAHRLLNVERNPIDLVEVKGISKRKKCPQVLQVKDAWQILDALVQPFRTIVLIGLCFGLRISEILGLRWTDFDFKRSVVRIQRSAAGKRLNKLKTEYSQDEVPIEKGFILELRKWQTLCLESEGRWLFPSPVTGRPYHADSIRADHLVPAGLQLGLGRIGFHTFRHYAGCQTIPGEIVFVSADGGLS